MQYTAIAGVQVVVPQIVELEGRGLIGYVANSPYTVIGESMSADRLYDKIGDEAVE